MNKTIPAILVTTFAVIATTVFGSSVWTGKGATGDWSDDGNWNPAAPAPGEEAVLPEGVVVSCSTADAAFMAELADVKIEAGATLKVDSVTKITELKAPLIGEGTLMVWTGNGNRLDISADNRGFSGDFVFSNSVVGVNHQFALGTTNRVYFNTLPTKRRLVFKKPGVYSNEFHIVACDMLEQQSSAVIAGPTYVENAVYMSWYGGSSASYCFSTSGDVRFREDETGTAYVKQFCKFLLPGEIYAGRAQLNCQGIDTRFSTRFHTSSRADIGGFAPKANIRLSDKNNGISFGIENAFDADVRVCQRYAYPISDAGCEFIDLRGFNQRVGVLMPYARSVTDMNVDCDPTSTIRSETPATLTILDKVSNDCQQNGFDSVFFHTVTGAASIELNSTNSANAGSIMFNCPGSTTTGGLFCRRGTMTLMANCTFPNLTKLEATGDGKIVVNTSHVADEGGRLTFVCSNNLQSAAVTLAEGVTLEAKTAFVGAKWLEPGTYGSAESSVKNSLDEQHVLDCLAGPGLLTVAEFGGPKGFMLILR